MSPTRHMKVPADRSPESRQKSLEQALSHIQKQFGEGAVMKLGGRPERFAIDVIPTGALSLDLALGVGGMPRGRIAEIYGQEGSGKTTIALHILAEAQKQGGTAAFIDAEHAFPLDYAANIGLNLDELLVSQPDTGEQALDICEVLIRSGAVDALAVDSVAALVPQAELDGEMGDSHVGLQARLMSQAMRRLSGAVAEARTVIIFINQVREKVGVMYGNPETTPGGRALKFWSSVRLEVRRRDPLKKGTEVIGSRVSVKVVKNKVAPPFRQAEFDIIYGQGISQSGCLLDLGTEMNVIEKTGTWFSYRGERLGQGRDNAKQFLEENPDIADVIEKEIRAQGGLGGLAVLRAAEAEDDVAQEDEKGGESAEL
ncbi:MAG: recombinase RecA [Candidatus Zipacnadales bacterium]